MERKRVSGGRVTVYHGVVCIWYQDNKFMTYRDASVVNLESGSVNDGVVLKKSIPYTTTCYYKIL